MTTDDVLPVTSNALISMPISARTAVITSIPVSVLQAIVRDQKIEILVFLCSCNRLRKAGSLGHSIARNFEKHRTPLSHAAYRWLLAQGHDAHNIVLAVDSMVTNEGSDPMFDLAELVAMRGFYAPPERYLDPGVSPLFGNFAGLPPLLFQVGGLELLLDGSTRAAARAHAAGVTVEVEIWESMGQVFQALPQARAALEHIARFIESRALVDV